MLSCRLRSTCQVWGIRISAVHLLLIVSLRKSHPHQVGPYIPAQHVGRDRQREVAMTYSVSVLLHSTQKH